MWLTLWFTIDRNAALKRKIKPRVNTDPITSWLHPGWCSTVEALSMSVNALLEWYPRLSKQTPVEWRPGTDWKFSLRYFWNSFNSSFGIATPISDAFVNSTADAFGLQLMSWQSVNCLGTEQFEVGKNTHSHLFTWFQSGKWINWKTRSRVRAISAYHQWANWAFHETHRIGRISSGCSIYQENGLLCTCPFHLNIQNPVHIKFDWSSVWYTDLAD